MKETIVVGGNVGGNVSSCQYKVSDIITGKKNLFVETHAALAVNNCSGETIKNDYWSLSLDGFIVIVVVLMALGIICQAIREY